MCEEGIDESIIYGRINMWYKEGDQMIKEE